MKILVLPHVYITDSGRQESGFGFERNDCTVRATAAAWGITYKQAHQLFALRGRKVGKGFSMAAFMWSPLTIATLGSVKDLPVSYRPSVRARTFIRSCDPAKRYVLCSHDHAFAVVDGKLVDQSERTLNCLVRMAWECQPALDRPGAINLPARIL